MWDFKKTIHSCICLSVCLFLLQAACGYTAARVMIMVPQNYIPLYFTDTLYMDKVSPKQALHSTECFNSLKPRET